MPAGKLMLVPRKSYKKSRKPKAKKAIDKSQNKRLSALEKANRAEQGWIDSEYREATMNRVPQIISRGVQDSGAPDPEFFTLAQGTDGSDKDHKRIGLSIKARSVKAHITISSRGSAAGYPPTAGPTSGFNQVRLLGVIYKTFADFNLGLDEVLQYSTDQGSHPCRLIDTYYKKQSVSNWKIWCDKKFAVPLTTQHKSVVLNYKVPDSCSKMVYAIDTISPPDTNIMVLYAMTGIRDNGQNVMTIQATYRCTFDK
jgi:hypothetical protein